MKKFLLALCIVAVPVTFSSCSDDDDDDTVSIELADAIKGEYGGTLAVTELSEIGVKDLGIGVEITKTAIDAVTIEIDELKANEKMTISFGKIEGVKLSGTAVSAVKIDEAEYKVSVAINGVKLSDYTPTVKGTVNGEKNLSLSLSLEVEAGLKGILADLVGEDNVPENLTIVIAAEKGADVPGAGDDNGDENGDGKEE